MNFTQRLGLAILAAITVVYVYFSFFADGVKLPDFSRQNREQRSEYNPLENTGSQSENVDEKTDSQLKTVKIFVLDKNGALRSLNRECNPQAGSCMEFAIRELINSPSKWEKNKGFTSEIPQNTKILSVRESSEGVMIDLSSDFETGGGAESTYMRVMQVIKTVNSNTNLPAYLYINGKQANVIGGEGIMVKQPLTERSLDE